MGALLHMALLAACALMPAACRASQMSELLQRADRVRTGDPVAASALLERAGALRDGATASELQHLRLLKAYERLLRGDHAAAIADAKALATGAGDPDIRHRAALLVANGAAVTRDYSQGLRFLQLALANRHRVTDPELRHAGLVVAATLYNQLGDHARALEHAGQALRLDLPARARCFARTERAMALIGLRAPVDERRDLHGPIADCRAQREPIVVGLGQAVLAEHLARGGRKREALSLLESSLPASRATGYSRLIGEFHGLIAEYRMDLGDTVGAASAARAVLQLKGQTPGWLPVVKAHRVLYRAALARGDTDAALVHYRRYAEADKARLDDVKTREYAIQLARYEWLKQKQAMTLLAKQNDVLRLEQRVASRTAWVLGLLVALLVVISASAAFAVWRGRRANRSLRLMAETDALTGLSNRRHFRALTERMLALCVEGGTPVSVLLLDLDHFKQINDECGHSAGDWVLREVARLGRTAGRNGDPFGRIGGEEFAMTLVGCDAADAMRIAGKICRTVATLDAAPAPCHRPVTVSIGVACTDAAGYDYEILLAQADAAMYRSKVGGRNRVTLADPDHPPHGRRDPDGRASRLLAGS